MAPRPGRSTAARRHQPQGVGRDLRPERAGLAHRRKAWARPQKPPQAPRGTQRRATAGHGGGQAHPPGRPGPGGRTAGSPPTRSHGPSHRWPLPRRASPRPAQRTRRAGPPGAQCGAPGPAPGPAAGTRPARRGEASLPSADGRDGQRDARATRSSLALLARALAAVPDRAGQGLAPGHRRSTAPSTACRPTRAGPTLVCQGCQRSTAVDADGRHDHGVGSEGQVHGLAKAARRSGIVHARLPRAIRHAP